MLQKRKAAAGKVKRGRKRKSAAEEAGGLPRLVTVKERVGFAME